MTTVDRLQEKNGVLFARSMGRILRPRAMGSIRVGRRVARNQEFAVIL